MSKIKKDDLAEIYIAALVDMGLAATMDGDGDVVFKFPNLGSFFVSLDAENDPEFLRLVFPNFTDQRLTDGDSQQLIFLVNQINQRNKVVKLYVRPGDDDSLNVSAAAECIIAAPNEAPAPDLVKSIMPRLISTIKAGVENLVRTGADGQGA